MSESRRNIAEFSPGGYRAPSKLRLMVWFLVSHLLIQPFWVPSVARVWLLKMFGARIGPGARVREGVYIHLPWNLELGPRTQLGRGVMILNHAMVPIGRDVIVSQQAVISSSGHEPGTAGLDYRHRAVRIDDGAWVALGAIVLPGSHVGVDATVGPGIVLNGESGDRMVVSVQGSHCYKRAALRWASGDY